MHIGKSEELDKHPTLIPGTGLQLIMDFLHSLKKPIVFRVLTNKKRLVLLARIFGKKLNQIAIAHFRKINFLHGLRTPNNISASRPTFMRSSQFLSDKYSLGDNQP